MIHLARLYCVKERKLGGGNEFFLVDVPVPEAKKRRLELESQGFTIMHTEVV